MMVPDDANDNLYACVHVHPVYPIYLLYEYLRRYVEDHDCLFVV